MTAEQLINEIRLVAQNGNVRLRDLRVNIRMSYDDDVAEVNGVAEDLFSQDNSTLVSICLIPLLEDE